MEIGTLNSHEIGHFTTGPKMSWSQGFPITIGSSLDPTLCLTNHSCDPNIMRVNVGKYTAVFAGKDIQRDEEV